MRAAPRRALLVGAVAASIGAAAALPVLASDPEPALVQVTSASGAVPVAGQYIVTLKNGTALDATVSKLRAASVRRFDGVLHGFAARLDAKQLGQLRRDSRVAAIEQDQKVRVSGTQRAPLPWGLDRIDQRRLPLSKAYGYYAQARNVNAYVLDSGLDTAHPDFGGRASIAWVAPRYASGKGYDCNGHGTHVAGTIGSKTYGVAKGVRLRGIKVMDCDGTGYLSDIIAGLQWLRGKAAKPAVANMSVGSAKSAAFNTASTNLAKTGVFLVVASGNESQDACRTSPASAGWVMAVGATNSKDTRPGWSNYGSCVDIHAPGYNITSTLPGRGKGLMSGTSMAAPHVAGAAALYLSTHTKATFPQVQKWLNDYSTKNLVKGLPRGTSNKLLYKSTL